MDNDSHEFCGSGYQVGVVGGVQFFVDVVLLHPLNDFLEPLVVERLGAPQDILELLESLDLPF